MEAGQLVEIRIRQKQLSAAVTLAASRRAVAAVSLLRAGSGKVKDKAEIAAATAKSEEMLARHEFECLTQLTEWIEEYMPHLEEEFNKIQRERAAEILPQIIQSVMVS